MVESVPETDGRVAGHVRAAWWDGDFQAVVLFFAAQFLILLPFFERRVAEWALYGFMGYLAGWVLVAPGQIYGRVARDVEAYERTRAFEARVRWTWFELTVGFIVMVPATYVFARAMNADIEGFDGVFNRLWAGFWGLYLIFGFPLVRRWVACDRQEAKDRG
ncbi:MAG: hypothetical protein IPP10_14930 [Candidatus Competibacteraceae bacterium]|nr:hypothetical protein [Candidatus Competibacteraceae bacterium]MBK8964209.1 hypothetical protein [Candidatus Competibacteraceae bacterium]MBK9952757.1 hypothetical protein [Candidatus Competibacteraceae bacterium]